MQTSNLQIETLKHRVEALDRKILEGDILGAVDAFFHPDVVTREGNAEEYTRGKAEKRARLEAFFEGIAQVNAVELHSQAVGEGVSLSEFTFDLTRTDGSRILWNEVLRRRWKDGLVIDERYYTAS